MVGRTKINFKMSYPKEIFFKKKGQFLFLKSNHQLKVTSFQSHFEALMVEKEGV